MHKMDESFHFDAGGQKGPYYKGIYILKQPFRLVSCSVVVSTRHFDFRHSIRFASDRVNGTEFGIRYAVSIVRIGAGETFFFSKALTLIFSFVIS